MTKPDIELLVATKNPGKIREIERLLDDLTIVLRSLDDFPQVTEPAETGTSFAANAALKAEYYALQTGLPALADDSGLEAVTPILDATPAQSSGRNHYGCRIAFGPDGLMYLTSGDRQKFDPAQNLGGNLGKVLRLTKEGEPAPGNPWASRGGVAAQLWTIGHRNPLGIAFAPDGRLWQTEMGPKGGDELNLIVRGRNYGWPRASNGSHYDTRDIPDHKAGDGFEPPKVFWTPSISPGGLLIYSGDLFPGWKGDAIVPALSGEALIRVDIDGENARKIDQWPMDARIRAADQGPDGAIFLLVDENSGGKLLRLTPAK